jgi:hypothetical protein
MPAHEYAGVEFLGRKGSQDIARQDFVGRESFHTDIGGSGMGSRRDIALTDNS